MVLKYYAFDWDDNILYMPTKILLEKFENGDWIDMPPVSTYEFAEIRSKIDSVNIRLKNGNPDDAFCEFKDYGERGDMAFSMDTSISIANKNFGPSWEDFIECLISGSLFAIITARGHESHSIRKGVEYIIDNYLSYDDLTIMYANLHKYIYLFRSKGEFRRILEGTPSNNKLISLYLDNCEFVGVSAPSRTGTAENPEEAKELALMDFMRKINNFVDKIGYKAKLGFSEDDPKNFERIEASIVSIHKELFPYILDFTLKKTTDPSNIYKNVIGLKKESSHQAPGLESSVLPFTKFSNMTERLYPKGKHNRQDDYANKFNREVNKLSDISDDILDDYIDYYEDDDSYDYPE